MNLSRSVIIAAAALGTAMVASVASSDAAVTADGIGALRHPLAPALLRLADAGLQPAAQSTRPLTEEQRNEIKSALESLSPETVKQAAEDIVAGIDTRVAASGTSEQAGLKARIHRTYEAWTKEHGDNPDRSALELLLVHLADDGVPLNDVIIPEVQKVREAYNRERSPRPPSASGPHPAVPVTVMHRR